MSQHLTGLEADEAPQRGDRPDSGALGGGRDRRVPGELLEVLVEKLLAAGERREEKVVST
jgi:hypothetical protein